MSVTSIPPFPSQDLAKLVLGYLAEEQLMTAYDEFLQASPYLDALKNEYDRIFMTSLKNILAEYRAVKIYVESCKPVALRRRLFGCANLLEVVKFLIQNIDYNKLQLNEPSTSRKRDSSANSSTVSASILSRLTECDVCNSLRLPTCVCKPCTVTSQSFSATSDTDASVETTSLEDLPGNQSQIKKTQVKLLEKITKVSISSSSEQDSEVFATSNKYLDKRSVSSIGRNATVTLSSNTQVQSTSAQDVSTPHCVRDQIQNEQLTNQTRISKDKIEEFNNILNTVCNAVKHVEGQSGNLTLGTNGNKRTSMGFQEFATGVHGRENTSAKPMPDSSTAESFAQLPTNNEKKYCGTRHGAIPTNENAQPHTKATILLTVGTVKNTGLQKDALNHEDPIRSKPTEQKVTILSDIKVDKTYPNDNNVNNNTTKMPPVLKNATSTPLMQMQTILINGTPAYKNDTKTMKLSHYTKDEIMAMPTIILVPSSGQPGATTSQTEPINGQASKGAEVSSSARILGPLVIDVASKNTYVKENNPEPLGLPSLNETVDNGNNESVNDENNESVNNETLVKTIETKNASMPKDMSDISKCTPHCHPPTRKASSTPRRNSHVRVLDFTTPRRILQDTINEHPSEQNSDDVEILISKSPNISTFANDVSVDTGKRIDSINNNSTVGSNLVDSTCTKENQNINKLQSLIKHTNWDADLRALVTAHHDTLDGLCETPAKHLVKVKPKTKKKEQSDSSKDSDKTSDKKPKRKTNKKKPLKNQKSPKELKRGTARTIKKSVPVSIPVKPTINIITDWNLPPEEDRDKVDKNINKSNEEQIDTPEAERLSLQNAIGAKLNISDLLETPYKQALYDIQMETPRFLGPDIPGEPLSDIKIMNIPTPRFLSSPKNSQPTPSSYSSRPTDYSSGGSYYKPEDQDYLRIDDLEYPESNIVNNNGMSKKLRDNESEAKNVKSSRPVRSCTRNVSYRSSSSKNKESIDKVEVSSDTSSKNSVCAKSQSKDKGKIEVKKRPSTSKRSRTPLKKDKSFIKIKPRRVTPVKDDGRSKRKLSESQTRKRTGSKEKVAHVTPAAAIPTKSRRKSSTPRKLHCTKTFTSESSGHESPDIIKNVDNTEDRAPSVQDSDTEHLPLRWSDDRSQDKQSKESIPDCSVNDSEDISKIQEFIAESGSTKTAFKESNLHIDLVKRGFDIETAKIIERDLLDIPSTSKSTTVFKINEVNESKQVDISLEKMNQSDTSNNLQIDEDKEINVEDEDDEEVELSVHECNEDTGNFISCCYDENLEKPKVPLEKLKDKYTMEVCIDDGVVVRLKATPFKITFEQECKDLETEMAVNSISNIDRLYTPLKDAVRAQCYEIFDSTLTSIDTPLKANSPKRKEREMMVTEIVLEIEKEEEKDTRNEGKKRKRDLSGSVSDESNESKKSKAEPRYLLNSASIQNIDIETVLSKLHGP